MIKSYKSRITYTPYFIEYFRSESEVLTGYKEKKRGTGYVSRPKTIVNKDRLSRAISRARKKLRLTVASNIDNKHDLKFWTFTFDPKFDNTAKNEAAAREYFRQFMKRFQRITSFKLKYLAIAELQKKNGRNAWHFHVLFFNLGFYPHSEMSRYWRGGFVFVSTQRTRIQSIQHMIIYLSKYLSKDTDVGRSKKLFWTSRGLKKPTVIYNPQSFDFSDWVLYSDLEVEMLDKPQYIIQTYYNSYGIYNNPNTVTRRKYIVDR